MSDSLKTVMLTVPLFTEAQSDDPILLQSRDLQLEAAKPGYLYGLQGLLKSKFLSVFAQKAGRERRSYRLVDLTLKIAVDPTQKFVAGQHIEQITMLSAKNMRSDVGGAIGDVWLRLAQEISGKKAVLSADINWAKPSEYMQAFPAVAPMLFESGLLPELRLIIMPMMTKLMKDPVWIGVVPLRMARDVVKAGQAMLHSGSVRLPMEDGASGGYFSLPAPPPFGG